MVTCKERRHIKFSLYGKPIADSRTLVSFARNECSSVVFMGRLSYREALLEGCPNSESNESLSPAAAALLSYEQFGINGLKKMEGDFSCLLWDSQKSHLFALRDPMGGYPLFWFKHEDSWIFSSSLKTLVPKMPMRRLNQEFLAEFLMSSGGTNEGPSENCVFEGVKRLHAGTLLEFQFKTEKISTSPRWNWLDQRIKPDGTTLASIADQYRFVLNGAVKECLQVPVACHLSGGMDSTSVALLARNLIRSGFGKAPLHTLSMVYERSGNLAKETFYLRELLESPKGYIPHVIPADDILDFDGFADLPFHEEPYAGAWRFGLAQATLDVTEKCGAASMLTGVGADDLLATRPFHLADLLRSGHWLQAWREALLWARNDNASPWSILKLYGTNPVLSGRRKNLMRWPKAIGLGDATTFSVPPWILPEYVRKFNLGDRAAENAKRHFFSAETTGLSVALAGIHSYVGDAIKGALATPRQLSIAHPFLDKRVLSLGFGIMSSMTPEPGRSKIVLGEAMRDVLPESIRHRRIKRHFTQLYFRGLNRNLPLITRILDRAPIGDLKMIDRKRFDQILQEASIGNFRADRTLRISSALSLMAWIDMHEKWYSEPEAEPSFVHSYNGGSE